MAADNILRSYGDNAAKEDVVLNAIEILTAREQQVFNMLGKTKAIATVHNYLTDTLATAASLAVNEGADYSAASLSTPSRLTNVIENVARPFKVTRTQQAIEHYHGENELQRQTRKALMDWGNGAEFDLVRSTLTSGASGTAPKMSKLSRLCYNYIYGKTSKVRLWWHYKKSQSRSVQRVLQSVAALQST